MESSYMNIIRTVCAQQVAGKEGIIQTGQNDEHEEGKSNNDG